MPAVRATVSLASVPFDGMSKISGNWVPSGATMCRLCGSVESLITAARRRGVLPNVDLGLAALGHESGMDVHAGDAIFAIARTAGWLAHAAEEYAEPVLRFRPRAQPREA